ncbi:uncharacterized protein VP01_5802g1 [Puccinia sorghi]|uniref:OTU domain-containing protein n=1 Tax=Puccinia sorghi TaxID=27349 RepID=A0A0L6UK93_9BASI|nr:uncharacterized protein VP01_5802g1 [Puccinia sorghi]
MYKRRLKIIPQLGKPLEIPRGGYNIITDTAFLQPPQYLRQFPPTIHQYIDKILEVEANGHCGFQVIAWALGCGKDAFMDFQKEIHGILEVQSEFYFNKGFLDERDRMAQIIHGEELRPCDINHLMSLTKSRNFMVLKMKD